MADTLNSLAATALPAEKAEFGQPTHTAIGAVASGANVATLTAPTANVQWYVTQAVVSFAATITSACTFTIKDDTTVIFQAEIPTMTNPGPIVFDWSKRALRGTAKKAVTGNLSTPGTIGSTITLLAFQAAAP